MILLFGLVVVRTVSGAEMAGPLDPAIASQLIELKGLKTSELPGRPDAVFRPLPLPQLLAVRDNLLADPASPRREVLLLQVVVNWGRLDGPAAFAYAREQQAVSRYGAIGASLIGWVATDPDRAWDTAMAHSNRGADRRYPIMSMLTLIGEQNMDHALRLYLDLLPDKACLQCAAAHLMVAASYGGEFDKVLAAARAMPAGLLRDALWGEYWSYLGSYLPEWGIRELSSIADPADRKIALTEFCKSWGRNHFDDCLEYILVRVDSSNRDDLILAVVQDWSRQAGHEEVVRVLKTLPVDLNDRALLGLASTLANLDAQAVLDWLMPRPYSQVRTNALDRAMWRWATLDPEAAHAYLLAVEDRETRGILLWNYLRAKVENGTFAYAELADIDAGYGFDWRVHLLANIGADLANPKVNTAGRYDLKEFIKVINARTDLPDETKRKILTPLEPGA